MTAVHPEASRQAVVEAALVLLERMGLSPADLATAPQPRKLVPTFAEYVPVVSVAVSAGDPAGVRLGQLANIPPGTLSVNETTMRATVSAVLDCR